MKKIVVIVIFFTFYHPAFSQTRYRAQIDSMKLALTNAKEDSTRLNLMVNMMAVYEHYNAEEGLTYEKQALEIANKVNQKIGTARVKDKIGRMYWRTGKFNEAEKYHVEALNRYNEVGDTYARNYVLVEIGQDYLNDTKFDEAGRYLLKALTLSEETGDKRNVVWTYDKLIALYKNVGNFSEASKATFANLKASEELGDKIEIAHAATLVAENFQMQDNNAEALKYFRQSLQLSTELKDQAEQTTDYNSIGDIYLGMGNYAEAENNYRAGIKVADKMENSFGTLTYLCRGMGNLYSSEGKYSLAVAYLLKSADELRPVASNHTLASLFSEIGIVYTKLNNYSVAKKYFDSSMALCKKLDTKIPLESYFSGKQLLDSATGNWKDAYEDYKQYASIKDSTFNRETLTKMVTSQVQYENEKKDLVAQEEIKRQRNIKNFSFAGLGLVLLSCILAYRQRNKIAKAKKHSDELLKDNELLLKEIHHRVKNNLEVISSLLALQSAQVDDPDIKEAMQQGQNRVHSIGIVHQKLYQGENLGHIEMKDYFINLSESILDSFGAEKRVTIECAMDQLDVDIDTAVPLGLIVNELLTNTLKYAFPEGKHGKVQIKLQKQPDGLLHLEVSDNGIGKSGLTHGTGFGGQLISLLTQQLSGTMREEIKDGTHIYFDFKPVKAA
jgi:two-component system, sensor histidine kinase PdtaS